MAAETSTDLFGATAFGATVTREPDAIRPSTPAAPTTTNSTPAAPVSTPQNPLALHVPTDATSTPASLCTTPRTADTAVDDDASFSDDAALPHSDHPLSAFYSHPTTRTSLEQLRTRSSVTVHRPSPSRSANHIPSNLPHTRGPSQSGADLDLESGLGEAKGGMVVVDHAAGLDSRASVVAAEKQCEVWPARCTAGARPRRPGCAGRVCAPLHRLSPRMQFVVKLAIALLVVGIATGLGIGISKAAGVGVWKNDSSTTAIGS